MTIVLTMMFALALAHLFVENGVYSPREVWSLQDRDFWRRWRSHFPFLSYGCAIDVVLLLSSSSVFAVVVIRRVASWWCQDYEGCCFSARGLGDDKVNGSRQ